MEGKELGGCSVLPPREAAAMPRKRVQRRQGAAPRWGWRAEAGDAGVRGEGALSLIKRETERDEGLGNKRRATDRGRESKCARGVRKAMAAAPFGGEARSGAAEATLEAWHFPSQEEEEGGAQLECVSRARCLLSVLARMSV